MARTTTTQCGSCGKPGSKKCGCCKNVHYCNIECQTADWHVHKSICSADIDSPPRPSAKHRRAILLPERSDRPQLLWISTYSEDADAEEEGAEADSPEVNDDEGIQDTETPPGGPIGSGDDKDAEDTEAEAKYDACDEFADDLGVPCYDSKEMEATPEFGSWLSDDDPIMIGTRMLVVGKLDGGEHLDHSIHLCFRDGFAGDGSSPNRCVDGLTRGKTASFWKGPLLLFGMTKVEGSRACVDLHPAKLTVALNGMVDDMEKQQGGIHYFLEKMKLGK